MKNIVLNKPNIEQVLARKKFTLALNVRRYTTDVNGTILDDAAIPASQKIPFPFHLFSEFDRNGGYQIADRLLSQVNNTKLYAVYPSWGVNTPLFLLSPLATINNEFQRGDTIFVYVDDYLAPSYYTFVVINGQNGAYASLVGQLNITQLDKNSWGAFKIFGLDYAFDTTEQLKNTLFIIKTEFDASFVADRIQPVAYYHTQYKPNIDKITIPIEAIANQFLGLSTFLSYGQNYLNLSFTVYA